MFAYSRRVAFSDTDAMGVVHHANYLRYIEEARVQWMRQHGLSVAHFPQNDHVLAVLHYQMWHYRPARFDDLLEVRLQVRKQGLKLHFQYAIFKDDVHLADAETLHIPVDSALKPVRPSRLLLEHMEKEKWTETWLSNS